MDSGPGCNNRCSVCPRPSPPTPEGAFLPLDGELAEGALFVHGGEPTLHPGFEALLARARQAGRAVSIETNARAFSVEGRALRAKQAGLVHATITLLAAKEASHDFLSRVPGSFRQTIAGASRLRLAGVKLSARLVVTRTSLLELSQMATVALGFGAGELRYSWARMDRLVAPAVPGAAMAPGEPPAFVRGRTVVHGKLEAPIHVHPTPAGDTSGYDLAREWLVPRYSLSVEALGAAQRTLQRVGKAAAVEGMPLCLVPAGLRVLPPARSCSTPWPNPIDASSGTAPRDAFHARCDGCTLRVRCPGVPSGYLARFGAAELVPSLPAASSA